MLIQQMIGTFNISLQPILSITTINLAMKHSFVLENEKNKNSNQLYFSSGCRLQYMHRTCFSLFALFYGLSIQEVHNVLFLEF